MSNQRTKHPSAGKTVIIQSGTLEGESFTVEDYWENLYGKSWLGSLWNPACIAYAIRVGLEDLPIDNEVLYGKIESLGYLIHISELEIAKETRSVPTN